VERAGSAVTAFKPGDEVYGFGHGAFAEYIAVDQDSLAPKPGNLTFEQAAAVPLAAVTALQGLRAGGIQPGQHVLIIGASGGVGTFAVQIATYLGAQVTGVCSTPHADLVRRLGAEHVIDRGCRSHAQVMMPARPPGRTTRAASAAARAGSAR
jgi:NADPH:quinone reductase-like Zn-dependent oxidoreductase